MHGYMYISRLLRHVLYPCFYLAAGFGFRTGEYEGRLIVLLIRNAENMQLEAMQRSYLRPITTDA